MVGADKIVGVDVNDSKEEWGRRFGMNAFRQPDQDRRRYRPAPGHADRRRSRLHLRLHRQHHRDATGRWRLLPTSGWVLCRSLSGWRKPERKFQPGHSSSLPAGSGRAPRSAARAASYRRAENRRLVHERQDPDRSDDHACPQAGGDQQGVRLNAPRQVDPFGRRILNPKNVKQEDRPMTVHIHPSVDNGG